MKKECAECGTVFSGRADAKFCSDQCRSTYHNRAQQDDNAFIREVNNALKKNRKILTQFNPDGKSRVKGVDLRRKGFDFNFFTNVYTTKDGREYRFCYDQGYLHTGEDWYTLVVRKPYV
jgi:hypothetical protein